jgi:hypothetical protein
LEDQGVNGKIILKVSLKKLIWQVIRVSSRALANVVMNLGWNFLTDLAAQKEFVAGSRSISKL